MNPEIEDRAHSELFEDYKKSPLKRLKFKTQSLFVRPRPNITISFENFIFLTIGIILFGIVAFSLGIEKGSKGISKKADADIEKLVVEKTENYTIQIASFKKIDAAEKTASQVKAMGYDTDVLPSGDYFRVCVGNFKQRKEAERVLINLKKRFADCYITRR